MYGKVCFVCFLVDHGEPEMRGMQRIDATIIRHSVLRIANRGITAKGKNTANHALHIAKPAHIYGEGTVERIKVAPASHLQITHRSRAIKFKVGISLDRR